MDEWLGHIQQNLLSQCLLHKNDSVIVAVSGGLDSSVLLAILHQLAPKFSWQLHIAHFNHRLRGRSSDADERFVRNTAKKLNIPITVGQGDVRAIALAKKISIEMAAREMRHSFFANVALQSGISKIALAQHANDQLELFFLRLQRGSGGEGLRGMKWRALSPANRKIQILRPLLSEARETLEKYAAENKIKFREDASNKTLDFQRNRIRHELIPILQKLQPPIFETALRSIDIIGAESDFVSEAAARYREKMNGAFDELHVAVQRRILHDELREQELPVDFALIERLRLAPNVICSVSPELFIFRDELGKIKKQISKSLGFRPERKMVNLSPSGSVQFTELQIEWSVENHTGPLTRKSNAEYFDAEKIGHEIELRFWQPGDQFQPIGLKHSVKLQDCFVNLKIPAASRRSKVVAAAENGEIFWVEGLRISERFKIGVNTSCRLSWRWKRD